MITLKLLYWVKTVLKTIFALMTLNSIVFLIVPPHPVLYYLITLLLHYSITLLFYYSIILLLYYYIILLLYYYITLLLYYYVTLLLYSLLYYLTCLPSSVSEDSKRIAPKLIQKLVNFFPNFYSDCRNVILSEFYPSGPFCHKTQLFVLQFVALR